MDVITTALTAAITDGGASAAYQMLKTRLAGKSPRVDEAIADLEDDPGSLSRQFAVSDALAAAGLAGDRYLRAAARNLVEEVDRREAATAGAAQEPNHAVLQIWFATDRAATGDRHPARQFGAGRGDTVYGSSEVSIPRDGLAADTRFPALLRLQGRPGTAPHAVLLRSEVASRETWLGALADAVRRSETKDLLLFVHGSRASFEDAVRRAARLTGALRFPGIAVLYSWPSQGRLSGTAVDETNVEWARVRLSGLLAAVLEDTPAERLCLVGHGMGARMAALAAADLLRDRPGDLARLRETVLVAPGIGNDAFPRDGVAALAGAGISVTLYASLAGSPADFAALPGVETVDIGSAGASLTGRGDSPALLNDLQQLITERLRAAQRSGLHAVDGPAGRYWTLND